MLNLCWLHVITDLPWLPRRSWNCESRCQHAPNSPSQQSYHPHSCRPAGIAIWRVIWAHEATNSPSLWAKIYPIAIIYGDSMLVIHGYPLSMGNTSPTMWYVAQKQRMPPSYGQMWNGNVRVVSVNLSESPRDCGWLMKNWRMDKIVIYTYIYIKCYITTVSVITVLPNTLSSAQYLT